MSDKRTLSVTSMSLRPNNHVSVYPNSVHFFLCFQTSQRICLCGTMFVILMRLNSPFCSREGAWSRRQGQFRKIRFVVALLSFVFGALHGAVRMAQRDIFSLISVLDPYVKVKVAGIKKKTKTVKQNLVLSALPASRDSDGSLLTQTCDFTIFRTQNGTRHSTLSTFRESSLSVSDVSCLQWRIKN